MSAVAAPASAATEALMGQICEDFLDRLERGDNPQAEDYAARYPDLAVTIRQVFPALEVIRRPEGGRIANPSHGWDGETSEAAEPALGCLGDFRLWREVGRGGMGVVYEAEQISLGRRVALKVLPFAAALDAKQLQRFKNEAQAAAHLHHQNIVPVYFVGCERAVHFYAMQFIAGQTLAQVISNLKLQNADLPKPVAGAEVLRVLRSPGSGSSGGSGASEYLRPGHATAAHNGEAAPADSKSAICNLKSAMVLTPPVAGLSTEQSITGPAFFRAVASLGMQAAQALDYSHEMGVVHRDVKPANLMLDDRGKIWITDFGLAHCQSQAGLTMSGDLVGTLRYMSPEQALAKRVVVDHRTDIYSLGATLYELLTLEPVFPGADRQDLLRQISFEEPKPPRRINKSIPAELETIVLKALEKNPADRYGTAKELADDLERFVKDEPIRARRPSLARRMRSWVRRHKVISTFTAMLLLGLAVLGVALLWWQERLSAAAAADASSRLGQFLAMHGKSQEAEEAFRKAIERKPDSAQAWNGLGRMLHVRREFAGAEAAFRKAVLLERDYAEAWFSLGMNLQDQGKLLEAEVAYRDAVRLRPTDAWSHNNLGTLYSELSRFPEAAEAYKKAIEQRPDDFAHRINLVSVLEHQKKVPEAVAVLRRATEEVREQYRAGAFILLGHQLYFLHRFPEAEAAYCKHVALTDNPFDGYHNIANVLYLQGKFPQALEASDKCIELAPHYPNAFNTRAQILRALQRLDEADAAESKANVLDHHAAQANRAWLLMAQGKFNESLVARAEGKSINLPGRAQSYEPFVQWVERCAQLDAKLPEILKGDSQPADVAESLALGELCQFPCRQFYAASTRLYSQAFAADPKLVGELRAGVRYSAACAAAQAGCGLGNDAANLVTKEYARLRGQALAWLRADMAGWRSAFAKDPTKAKIGVDYEMLQWQQSPSLACVRGDEALAKLPEAERREWRKLWEEVAELERRAAAMQAPAAK